MPTAGMAYKQRMRVPRRPADFERDARSFLCFLCACLRYIRGYETPVMKILLANSFIFEVTVQCPDTEVGLLYLYNLSLYLFAL